MKRRLFSLILAISMLFSIMSSAEAARLPENGSDLRGMVVILHTNDIHGRISRGDGLAGFSSVSALKKAFTDAGAYVLLVDAGDVLHGLPAATINKGADVVRIMNAVGYDLMTPGNHDFNYGTERLVELSKLMNFPVISANVISKETGKTIFDAYAIVKKGGITFGFFGLSTPETAYKTNPKNVKTVVFKNPVEYAAKQVSELKKKNVDYIVALTHLGVDAASEYTSDKIAAKVRGIDLIIDGHSHTLMVGGKPVDESIILTEHGDTLIVSSGEYIKNIGVVIISADGEISSGFIPYSEDIPSDAGIDELVAAISMLSDVTLSEVIGTTAVKLSGEREYSRRQETNLGNLAADAIRAATDADVAFTNGGGIRASIEAGDITKKDLVTVFPFGNYVVTKRVTGKALLAAMEHGVKDYPDLSGGFPQVSGITFQIDASKPAGSRIGGAMVGGKDLDPNSFYLLATNDFLAGGGDDYTMLDEFGIVNEYASLEEILITFIQAHPDLAPEVEGRITVINASS